MKRNTGSFCRPDARYLPQPTVLVICEDKKSGKQYLEDATIHFRIKVKVEVSHCGYTDPKGIVEEAIDRQSKFDQVYCVVDRDRHENFDEALTLAQGHPKITIITSYPCFEFWLLLHFGFSRKPYREAGKSSAGDRVIDDLRNCPGMGNYAKGASHGLFSSLLGEKFDTARKVAPKVLQQANDSNEKNPSTLIHNLIDVFDSLSKLKSNGK